MFQGLLFDPFVSLTSHPIIISKAYAEALESKDDDKGWLQKTVQARKQ